MSLDWAAGQSGFTPLHLKVISQWKNTIDIYDIRLHQYKARVSRI